MQRELASLYVDTLGRLHYQQGETNQVIACSTGISQLIRVLERPLILPDQPGGDINSYLGGTIAGVVVLDVGQRLLLLTWSPDFQVIERILLTKVVAAVSRERASAVLLNNIWRGYSYPIWVAPADGNVRRFLLYDYPHQGEFLFRAGVYVLNTANTRLLSYAVNCLAGLTGEDSLWLGIFPNAEGGQENWLQAQYRISLPSVHRLCLPRFLTVDGRLGRLDYRALRVGQLPAFTYVADQVRDLGPLALKDQGSLHCLQLEENRVTLADCFMAGSQVEWLAFQPFLAQGGSPYQMALCTTDYRLALVHYDRESRELSLRWVNNDEDRRYKYKSARATSQLAP